MTLDKTLNGTIHTTANGLHIGFDNGDYYITDGINDTYLCKFSKREKLFSFYRRNDVQFMSYKEFINEFNKVFKRKAVNWA